MTRARYVDEFRGTPVADVAEARGYEQRPARGASGGQIIGCPACNAKTRHPGRSDRRGSVGITSTRLGWRCFECDASGDALDFLSYDLGGARFRDLPEPRRAELAEWARAFLGLANANGVAQPRQPAKVIPLTPEPPRFPAAQERDGLLGRCVPVTDDDQVAAYLASRGIDAERTRDRRLARALPRGAQMPAWARIGGRSWSDSGHRLIVPVFDAEGRCRSVLARRVEGDAELPKSIAPTGYGRRGLVMACRLGRELLATGARPEWWPASGPELRVVIVEGETDYLVAALEHGDADENAPAVFGIVSGAWTPEIAARVPDGSHVIVATDPDEAGEKYARTIVETFASRDVRLFRWRPAA